VDQVFFTVTTTVIFFMGLAASIIIVKTARIFSIQFKKLKRPDTPDTMLINIVFKKIDDFLSVKCTLLDSRKAKPRDRSVGPVDGMGDGWLTGFEVQRYENVPQSWDVKNSLKTLPAVDLCKTL